MSTNNFLQLFHENNKINFRVINTHQNKRFNLYGTYNELKEQLDFYNDQNFDVYFTVNSGGTKQPEINKINAVFIDLDCGKDENKQYFSPEHVNKYKQEQINKINQFKFKPSAIIETRNGLHVYWIINNATIEQFTQCQSLLIQYFNSDPAVKTIERIMRVPNYYWNKDIHNKYKITIQSINENSYNIADILELLNATITNNQMNEKTVKIRKSIYNTSFTLTENSNVYIKAIVDGDIEVLQALLKPEPVIIENQNLFYKHITENIKLHEFLGLPFYKSFKCIFHTDNSPSAGIFITEFKQYFYKCHSSSCDFMGNIIRCVERLRRCNRPKAIKFIKEVYKITVKESEWQQEQKEILEENKRVIRSEEFKAQYPKIHNLIKRYIPLLATIHDIAIDNVYDEKYSDDDNNVIFYTSITKISEMMGVKFNPKFSDRVGLLAFLHLIKKLSEEQIPENYLKKAKHYAALNNKNNIMNFYSIPSYCDDLLLNTLERSIMYEDNNISMTGWSRELLQRTFGDEIANEIYPFFKHRKLTQKSIVRTEHIHKVTIDLINTYGYALEKDILHNLVEMYSGMNQKFSKDQLHKQIKKSLQEMLDTYGWQRVRMTKELKNTYGINTAGYPFAIINN